MGKTMFNSVPFGESADQIYAAIENNQIEEEALWKSTYQVELSEFCLVCQIQIFVEQLVALKHSAYLVKESNHLQSKPTKMS